MEPDLESAYEVEGVLNPGSVRDGDGRLLLLPRLVARGNVSRVGLAEVRCVDGVPVGVERLGMVLEPTERWEQGAQYGGVEDPRITTISALGVHVMTYVALGPRGPRIALAVSTDALSWRRIGPLLFDYDPALGIDLNLYPNKDAVLFPDPVPGPGGEPCIALLHRPMWDLSWVQPGEGNVLPFGLEDPRPGIWVSYVPLADVVVDLRHLARVGGSRLVALPEHPWEALKIGAGPPPVRVPEGWLLLHHGVSGTLDPGFGLQQRVHYAAGAMVLAADDVGRVLARSATSLLRPETPEEVAGVVPNVVFPTAIETTAAGKFVFYGMADARIGVARLDREDEVTSQN